MDRTERFCPIARLLHERRVVSRNALLQVLRATISAEVARMAKRGA